MSVDPNVEPDAIQDDFDDQDVDDRPEQDDDNDQDT